MPLKSISGGDSLRLPRALLPTLLSALLLAGCAGAMRNYDKEMSGAMSNVKSGRVDDALAQLEANNTSADKDLLYFLEKGELLRLKGSLPESKEAWLKADESVRAWEEIAKTDPQRILGEAGAFLVNDKTRRYDGQDYEKVLLSARLAMDHVALGRWDDARVEVKKLHEREAIIAALREKDLEDSKEKAKENKVQTTMKDLKGYPVEIFDDPEVISLRNGYQSAIGHYLAGFVYESLGENSLASAGYRQAIELRPDQPLLQSGLADLEKRSSPRQGGTDVLIVVESGSAPAWKSITIPIPVPTNRGVVMTPASFPVVKSQGLGSFPRALRVDGRDIPVAPVTNVDAQARRALKDQMPGIVVRTVIRAVAKGLLQSEVQKRDNTGILSVLTLAANFATEQADERSWRSLPGMVGIARTNLPPGRHQIQTPVGAAEITVGGRHQLVTLRFGDDRFYLTQSPAPANGMVGEVQADTSPISPAATETTKPDSPRKKPAAPQGKATPKMKPEVATPANSANAAPAEAADGAAPPASEAKAPGKGLKAKKPQEKPQTKGDGADSSQPAANAAANPAASPAPTPKPEAK